jgi:hypothetical protein
VEIAELARQDIVESDRRRLSSSIRPEHTLLRSIAVEKRMKKSSDKFANRSSQYSALSRQCLFKGNVNLNTFVQFG